MHSGAETQQPTGPASGTPRQSVGGARAWLAVAIPWAANPSRHLPAALRARLGARSIAAGRGTVTGLLLAAALFRLVLVLRGWPPLNSDESVIGLMARHILTRGEAPTFFWGQAYMGAFQAYVVAGVFWLLGSSTVALHLTVALLSLAFLAGMYLLGRASYGPAVGLLLLLWFSFGPPVAVLRELSAIGGYLDMLVFGPLILGGAWLRLRRPESFPQGRAALARCLLTYGAIGLCAGIGFWSDLLLAPAILAAAGALLLARPREALSVAGLVAVLAFGVGAFPYISYNITNQNATLAQVLRQTKPGDRMSGLPAQIGQTLSVALPSTFGSPHVCINRGNIAEGYPPPLAERTTQAGGPCDVGNIAFSLGILSIFAFVAFQLGRAVLRTAASAWQELRVDLYNVPRRVALWRQVRRSWRRELSPQQAEHRARLWLRAMLLLVILLTLALYVSSRDAQRYQFTSARYLLLIYLGAPLLFGPLWRATLPGLALLRRWRRAEWHPRARPVPRPQTVRALAASVSLIGLLALSAGGGALTLAHAADASAYALPDSPEDQQVIAFLDARGVTRFYADYWTCYRLAFETNERLRCAVRGQHGRAGLPLMNNRYDPYIREVEQVPAPAYILPAGTAQDATFYNAAEAEGLPHQGYERTVVASYAIYTAPAER